MVISIERPLCDAADAIALELNVSRSQVYVIAMQEAVLPILKTS